MGKLAMASRTETFSEILNLTPQEITALGADGLKSGRFVVQSLVTPNIYVLHTNQERIDGIIAHNVRGADLVEGANVIQRLRGGDIFRDVIEAANNTNIETAITPYDDTEGTGVLNYKTVLEKQGFTIINHHGANSI